MEPQRHDVQLHGKGDDRIRDGALIIAGEIDLSVASIIALASTAMGAAVQAGVGTPGLVLIGLGVGLLCGAFNGFLVTRMGLPSIVVTIGTMSLFRGYQLHRSRGSGLSRLSVRLLPSSDRVTSSG